MFTKRRLMINALVTIFVLCAVFPITQSIRTLQAQTTPEPPFDGTVYINPDIITSSDPTAFEEAVPNGQDLREMFDYRVDKWVEVDAYLFDVSFDDGLEVEFQVNPEFGSMEAALDETEKYAEILGQMPTGLRTGVETFSIQMGPGSFGASEGNIVIHTGEAESDDEGGFVEEGFFHEVVHISIDPVYEDEQGWLDAQAADGTFISTYAQNNPTTEDMAESFLPYFALRYLPDRISEELKDIIIETIPNRIEYFDSIEFDTYPLLTEIPDEPEPTPTPSGPAAGESDINLTIESFTFDPPNPQPGQEVMINLVIANIGDEDVDDIFYVDLYINPPSPIEQGGDDWVDADSLQGIEWVIEGLAAGEVAELTSESDSFDPGFTEWFGELPVDAAEIYVYVDSWAENSSPNGLIRESDETDNGTMVVIEIDDSAPVPTATPFEPTSQPTAQPTNQPTPDSNGGDSRFEASINFRPNTDGFGFENWGGDTYSEDQDLNTGQLIRMFGANNVCRKGNTANDCVLKAAARQWRLQELKDWRGGHCYGMAVASQRFFVGTDSPSNYEPTINQTVDLQPLAPIRASITEWATSQTLSFADGRPDQEIDSAGRTPSQMLDVIREQFITKPNDPYVLGFSQTGKGGHAVTPYGIENKGNGIYWLYIYDNNWPNQERYIIFDTNRETWLYSFAALNSSEPSDIWRGDARTESLDLMPTSAHVTSGWACPFCEGDFARRDGVSQIEFNLSGDGGAMLIIDPNDNVIGYDFENKQDVNDFADTNVRARIGGQGVELSPTYQLPLVEDGLYPYYEIYVASQYVTGTVDSDLQINGPGYSVGLELIQISEGEDLLITVRPDGRQLTFNASEEGTWGPDIYFALDPDPAGDSYIFEIEGFVLESFKTVTATINLDEGELLFEDDDGTSDTYGLDVLRIDKDGNEFFFGNDSIEVGAEDDAVVDFGNWDGESDMSFTIAGAKQTFQSVLPNQPTQDGETTYMIYLPVLRK